MFLPLSKGGCNQNKFEAVNKSGDPNSKFRKKEHF